MAKPKTNKSKRAVVKRKGRKPRAQRRSPPSPYVDMFLDPCNATLTPGLHTTSEGILSRHKTVYQPSGTETSGYILWSPYYATNLAPSAGPSQAACIYYQSNASNVGPQNTVGDPAFTGTGGITNTGIPLAVGATDFILSSTCADFRLLSSCMKVTYTGSMTNSQGTIAFIENLAPEAIFSPGAVGRAVSVDRLIQNSSKYHRLGIDTEEIIFRQDETLSGEFHGDTISPISLGDSGVVATVQSAESQRAQPSFYGFAWKGQLADTLIFEFIQNIEWRPSTQSGIVNMAPVAVSMPNQVALAHRVLDVNAPGWATSARKYVHNANKALDIAQMAFTGVERAGKLAYKYGPSAVKWATKAAPFLI